MFDGNQVGALGDVWGGGISAGGSTITVDRCTFTGNSAFGAKGGDEGWGGAIYAEDCNSTIRECEFHGNSADLGGAIYVSGGSAEISDCVLLGNAAVLGGALGCVDGATPDAIRCTMVENEAAEAGSGVYVAAGSGALLSNTIVAFGRKSEAVACDTDGAELDCCDVYGSAGGNWVGCIAAQQNSNDNLEADPLFCNVGAGDLRLAKNSPCAPEQSACGLIGAVAVGCPTAIESATWGAIKASFK